MKAHTSRAFTLVELLVSMAVLVLLITLVMQLVNSATAVTTGSRKQLDTDAQARMIFDRITDDFKKMINRRDVDCLFSRQSVGNDKMFFFSEAPAYSGTTLASKRSTTALIGYRINSSYQLERLGKVLTWDGKGNSPGGIVFLTFPAPNASSTPIPSSTLTGNWTTTIGSAPTYNNGTDSDYHVLAETAYRMEFCFQVKDLTDPNAPSAAYSNYPIAYFSPASTNKSSIGSGTPSNGKAGDRYYDTQANRAYICTNGTGTGADAVWQLNGMDDVLGVVVTIALLDNGSRQIVKDPGTGTIQKTIGDKMIAAFANPTDSELQSNPPKLMAETWQAALYNNDFATATGLPRIAASQIRIYQRLITLPQ